MEATHQALNEPSGRSKGLAKPGHDPALWLLLEDDEGLAGAALGERWEDREGGAWPSWGSRRGRAGPGYGRALLLGLLAGFRRAGGHAELTVHGRNRGARYESVWEAER